jgi:hypothetical protein
MIGRVEETSASSKPGPRLDSTRQRGARGNSRPYRDMLFAALHMSAHDRELRRERRAGAVAPNVLDRAFQAPAPNRK